jgi:trimeric autotransporter adhesin
MAYGLSVLGVLALPLASVKAQVGQSLEQRVEQLEYKLAHVTSGPDDITISGANLHIVNGLGATDTTNGLGNLIVGYNEPRLPHTCPVLVPCTDARTGSHNVIVGRAQNFTSFGGLVVAQFNTMSGPWASVSGGIGNTASGVNASVSGGSLNTASGVDGSVSGGLLNTASGLPAASVSGGQRNIASGTVASISGGIDNTASGSGSSVNGGERNTTIGTVASISGGIDNTATGGSSSVSGGSLNRTFGSSASVSGGENNTASGNFSSVSGGTNRSAPGTENWAAGALFQPN